MKNIAILLSFLFLAAVPSPCFAQYTPQQEKLLNALIMVESGGKDDAIGDNGKAIGCLQIWKPYWQDATERSGIGGNYVDCMDRAYAKSIVDAYMKRYAKAAWTDPNLFNAQTVARIHNGGPRGHTKESTKKYWKKVQKVLAIL